jgi:hypothetical protein
MRYGLKKPRRFPSLDKRWSLRIVSMEEDSIDCSSVTWSEDIRSGGFSCFVDPKREGLEEGSFVALELINDTFPSSLISLGKIIDRKVPLNKRREVQLRIEFWWIGWETRDSPRELASLMEKRLRATA